MRSTLSISRSLLLLLLVVVLGLVSSSSSSSLYPPPKRYDNYDIYDCPEDVNLLLPRLRSVILTLDCDPLGTLDTVEFGPIAEDLTCIYTATGKTFAACGQLAVPSSSPTPSNTPTPSTSNSGTSSTSPSFTPSVTPSTSFSPSTSPSGTASTTATPVLIEVLFTPLDRDVGIGGLGAVCGIVSAFACLFVGRRAFGQAGGRVGGGGGGGGVPQNWGQRGGAGIYTDTVDYGISRGTTEGRRGNTPSFSRGGAGYNNGDFAGYGTI